MWEIEARAEIAVLLGEYVRHVDSGRPESLAELFAADAVYDIDNGDVARGRDEIPERVRSLIPMFASAVDFGRIRHHTASARIEFTDSQHAKVTSYFTAFSRQGPDHWGVYRDVVASTPDGWRFAERVARVEGAVRDSPLRTWFTD